MKVVSLWELYILFYKLNPKCLKSVKSVLFKHLRHAYDFIKKKSQKNIIICWYFLIFYKARRRNLLVPKARQ